jgi:hypothetical protein
VHHQQQRHADGMSVLAHRKKALSYGETTHSGVFVVVAATRHNALPLFNPVTLFTELLMPLKVAAVTSPIRCNKDAR